MGKYVFRPQSGKGSDTLAGWTESDQYRNEAITNIADPSGSSANLPITSIPTPFAIFELARNAFEQITSSKKLSGITIYHKLVSEALDVLEIIANFSKFTDDFEIIEWDMQADMSDMIQSSNVAHSRLGNTLQLYKSQDKKFNFDQLNTLYLLNYKNGPKRLNIVGSTSPITVSAPSANDLSYVNVHLSNNHKAFEARKEGNDENDKLNNYPSLINRSPEFIKYVYALSRVQIYDAMGTFAFSAYFKEVYAYVEYCFEQLKDEQLKAELRLIDTDYYFNNYTPVNNGQPQYFIGMIPMLQMCSQSVNISQTSDFRLAAQKSVNILPLVLPNMPYARPGMKYTSGFWDPHNKAPFADSTPIGERTLPFDGTAYPYLVADDLFEPYLIQLPYPIDGEKFFTGGYENKEKSYLIPLKRTILDYFNADFLNGKTEDNYGQPIFEFKELVNGVKAILRLPIQKRQYITFERIYMDTNEGPNVEANEGGICKCQFDIFIYPFFHTNEHLEGPQRIYLIDGDKKSLTTRHEYSISVGTDSGEKVDTREILRENKRENTNPMTTKYFLCDQEYDYIMVSNKYAQGLIIPNWHVYSSQGKTFHFAIDFGTTNTHVEYRSEMDHDSKPLDYAAMDKTVASLHKNHIEVEEQLYNKNLIEFYKLNLQEFLPLSFGGSNHDLHFPMRTNLCEPKNLKRDGYEMSALADATIGFHYEKEPTAMHNDTRTNLKWEGGGNSQFVALYIEQLLYLIRAKVIACGGDLNKVNITWFYPVSMLTYQVNGLTTQWQNLANKVLGPGATVKGYTESVAPYFYYKNKQGVNSLRRPVASLDIGGGTSDIVVYQNNQPVIISSSRFAGDNIYGDFVGMSIDLNGFVQRYGERVSALLSTTQLSSCYESIRGKGRSADLVSFMFSLKDNQILKQANLKVDFSAMLTEDYQMKTVLVLFYAAEIYHLAHLLKSRGIPTPAYLTVSGTASKMLKIISPQTKPLETLATLIFNEVLGDNESVSLKTVDCPKEITCRGGLNMVNEDLDINTNELKYNISGSETFDSGNKVFGRVNETVMREVQQSYIEFIDFFFKLDGKKGFRYKDAFGLDSQNFGKYRKELFEHADEDIASVLDARLKEANNDSNAEVDDSLFFFPLAGGINRLAYLISQNNKE